MRRIVNISSIIFAALFAGNSACAQGIIIPSGSYMVQDGANLITTGNFTNNGSFTQNGGTLIFAGTTQSIDGTSTDAFDNVTIETGSTTTIDAANQRIKGILKSNGTLNAGGKLTLLSTAAQTALIDGEGTGSVLGNVIMQRYLAEGNGYKYVSSPFQSATVNQFSDDLDLDADFPTFYEYNEDDESSGWVIYTTSTNALTPVKGYAANFGSSSAPKTIDATGVVNNGNMSAGTLYNHNQAYTLGFNLVGNPYPSPIDWEAPTGWTRVNIDDAIYFFNASEFQYTGHYSSYINGVSSDDIANGIIPAMQGFFVHVSDGSYPVSATFSMNNNVRVNNLTALYHKNGPDERPLIRLTAKYTDDTAVSDAIVVYFDEAASGGFDKKYDALKMMNTEDRVPNLYVSAADANKLSISAMPEPSDSIDAIPLGLTAKDNSWITFKAPLIQHMPYGLNLYLADARTNTIEELIPNKEYRFLIASIEDESRFSIVFSKKPLIHSVFTYNGINAYSNGSKLMVNLSLATGEKGDLVLRNILGQDINTVSLNGYGYHEVDLPDAKGIYMLSLYSDKGVFTRKMFLSRER